MENKKITRLDILKKAKEIFLSDKNVRGLCNAIYTAFVVLDVFNSPYRLFNIKISDYIPLFTFENAKKFGADGREYWYWWNPGEWDNGRLDFLNWLIEQYQGDDTDIDSIEID